MASEKLYRIGAAAQALGVRTSVLRFWETEFPELAPVRRESGQRSYSERDMALLKRIRDLLYVRGLTIEGARQALSRTSGLTSMTEDEKQTRLQQLEERRRHRVSVRHAKEARHRDQKQDFVLGLVQELKGIRRLLEQADSSRAGSNPAGKEKKNS